MGNQENHKLQANDFNAPAKESARRPPKAAARMPRNSPAKISADYPRPALGLL